MTYSETIREGFRLVNSRWQLVAVHIGMMIFNCLGFFIFVGVPLGIAFIIFGLDLSALSGMNSVFELLKNPAGLFSRYFGLALMVIASFLFYMLIVTTVWLYVLSGSAGIIGRALLEPSRGFSMSAFFREAGRLFFPMLRYTFFVGLLFIAVTFALGLLGGLSVAVVSAAVSQDSTLALFLKIFFSLILLVAGMTLILSVLAVAVYGVAMLFFRGEGAVKAFRSSFSYLWHNQKAFWLYILLLAGYILASFALMTVVYPLNLIPIIGTVLSLPFQLISYAIQGYLGLVLIASIFVYYFDAEVRTRLQQTGPLPDPEREGTIAGGSIPSGDISESGDLGPEPPPQGSGENREM
jgi:hypothetical protein